MGIKVKFTFVPVCLHVTFVTVHYYNHYQKQQLPISVTVYIMIVLSWVLASIFIIAFKWPVLTLQNTAVFGLMKEVVSLYIIDLSKR